MDVGRQNKPLKSSSARGTHRQDKTRLSATHKHSARLKTRPHHHESTAQPSHPDHTSNSLAVHSNPMQLATRSLSARNLAPAHSSLSSSSAQTADSAHTAVRPSSSIPFARRKAQTSSHGSKKRAGSSTVVERLKIPAEKGFNIADHLRNSVSSEKLRDSTSPDVHKILQDISAAVVRTDSPTLSGEPSTTGRSGVSASSDSTGKHNRRAYLRSKVAANFSTQGSVGTNGSISAGTNGHFDDKHKGGVGLNGHFNGEGEQEAVVNDGRGSSAKHKVNGAASTNPNGHFTTDGREETSMNGGKDGQVAIGQETAINGDKPAVMRARHDHGSKRPVIPHLDIAGTEHKPASSSNGHSTKPQSSGARHGTNTQSNVDTGFKPAANGGNITPQPNGAYHGNSEAKMNGSNGIESTASVRHPPPPHSKKEPSLKPPHDSANTAGDLEREQVRILLERKKDFLTQSRLEALERAQSEVEARERQQREREQRRAAKMRADRKMAIEELRRKREERLQLQERLAQEELNALQASGKLKKAKLKVRSSDKKKTAQASSQVEEGAESKTIPVATNVTQDHLAGEVLEDGTADPQQSSTAHSPPTSSNHTLSTYDDIMNTLRLLEAAPPSLEPGQQVPPSSGHGKQGTLSEGKLQSILSYLDQVEQAELDRSNLLAKSVSRGKGSSLVQEPSSAAVLALQRNDETELEAAAATANDVTATIMAQRLELDSKTKTVEMLQKALNQQRELTMYHAKEMERDGQKRIELQKSEYEATIQRHQCFIDQLIDDKKVLSERCEQLVKEMRDLDKKYKTKLNSLETSHAAELTKLKQVSAAAEKMRREKWQADEVQRIKETTVKGLEPEIQRIIAKGKAEVQRLKAVHEAELMQVDERASRRFVAQMEEVREQCAQEKEQACAHERELARQRYEKMAEQEELNYQQQRRRLFAEVAQEKEKMAEQLQRQKTTFDLQLKENTALHERQAEEQKEIQQQQLEEIRLRHRSELHQKQEQLEAERVSWQENLLRRQETDMMGKERELRNKLREERDKEIEMVISRLEEETASAKEETERASEARVRRIREKYEAELKEVEKSERSTLEKFNTMKSRVLELEGEVAQLRSGLRLKEQEVEKIGQVASKLTQERDSVSDVVRQEFADRLVTTEEENKELKREMSELRARHKVELERLRKAKDKELEEVHERVKQALEKKEENLKALKEQHESALKRADHLQMLLQKQRTQLLKK